MKYRFSRPLLLTVLSLLTFWLVAQKPVSKATPEPGWKMPDPLISSDGKVVSDADTWVKVRRPEILHMFETELYGTAPGPPEEMTARVVAEHTSGKVTYKQVEIDLVQDGNTVTLSVLMCLPANAEGPVPVFLGMNFMGNHTVSPDPGIIIPQASPQQEEGEDNEHGSRTEPRGSLASRWPVELVADRGYGIVTLPRTGGQKLFPEFSGPDDWGRLSSWSWSMRRVIDYLETDDDIDSQRIAVVGTSRLGKVALWTGATDERVRMVIPVCTGGCGGVSLMSKRFYGEASDELTGGIGHDKVCGNFIKYLDNKAVLPFDQHMLIALIAPRPIYVGTAEGQKEPQNQGMYMALKYAGPVYRLLGAEGFGAETMPGVHQPVMTNMGFHIREGKHGIEVYDWECFLDFADKHL